jgi:hypothetical protein
VTAFDPHRHQACVLTWLENVLGGGDPDSAERLAEALELAFALLWRRALRLLGEVTLTAIAERVLHSSIEKFPVLAPLEVKLGSGLQCQEFRAQARRMSEATLAPAVEFLLVEFLAVLGTLTAEILSQALHEVLCASTGSSASERAGGAAERSRKLTHGAES